MSEVQDFNLETRLKNSNDASSGKSSTAHRTHSFQPESDPLLKTFRKIQWLKMRQKNMKIAIKAEEIKKNEEYTDLEVEKLIERIADLQTEYFNGTTSKTVQEMIIARLQLADVLYKTLLENHEDSKDKEDSDISKVISDDDKAKLKELLSEQTKLSAELSLDLQEINTLEDQILKKKLELSEVAVVREQMMKNIQQREEEKAKEKEASKSEEIQRLQEKTKKRTAPLHILNNILQTLIAHCGLNWADDKDLTELVIALGKPLEQQLEENKNSFCS